MPTKHPMPSFLLGLMDQEAYSSWIEYKAKAHQKRDQLRGNLRACRAEYRAAIHAAVLQSGGRDAYTGEPLDWTLIGTYNNDDSAAGRRAYKHGFALLPTIDHVGDGLGAADFKICGWRVNDAKHDLDMPAFLAVCQAVLEHHGYVITRPDTLCKERATQT